MCGMRWGVAECGSFQQDPSHDDGDDGETIPVVANSCFVGAEAVLSSSGMRPTRGGAGASISKFPSFFKISSF